MVWPIFPYPNKAIFINRNKIKIIIIKNKRSKINEFNRENIFGKYLRSDLIEEEIK